MVASNTSGAPVAAQGRRVFISYKRRSDPDTPLASFLHDSLRRLDHDVFMDVEIPPGADWSDVISTHIRQADFFIVLLSEASVPQGYVVAETELAADIETQSGRPKILPVRVAFTDPLPLRLSARIGHRQYFEWRDAADNDKLLSALLPVIGTSGADADRPTSLLRGDHFIVSGAAWFSAEPRERLAGTTVVPVVAGEETQLAIARSRGPGFFGVRVRDDGQLEVAVWKSAAYRAVESQPGVFVPMLDEDSHGWCFARYRPDECVVIERRDGRRDPIVVSFDREVVRSAWRITHQRGTQVDSFLIVAKDSA